MSIKYAQKQKISSVEIGWSGLSMSDLIIGNTKTSINEHYVNRLETIFGMKKGSFSNQLRYEMPHDVKIQTQALARMGFEAASSKLDHMIYKVLKEKYKYVIRGRVPGEAVYRDSETREIVKVFSCTCQNSRYELNDTSISVYSTNPELAKKLLIKSIGDRNDGGFSLDTKRIVAGLEDLTADAQPHGTIFWDPETKGLIKTSPGYDLQIPDRIIETTEELDIDAVYNFIRTYLQNNRLQT